jgi:integrase
VGLTDIEIHALLRAAGASSHGLAARNYALAQLMLQAGLRVGEVADICKTACKTFQIPGVNSVQ